VSTVLAEATRGGTVESVHAGVVVVVNVHGDVIAEAGDPDTFAYFRSSAKPFQAIPVVESGAADRFGFTPAELALCCASHNAELRHQEQVAAILAKLGLTEAALQCGTPLSSDDDEKGKVLAGIRPRSPLQCDCSGKHSGMLAASLQLGYPIDNYLDPAHPLQQHIKGIISEVCRVSADEIAMATDGCSLPTFGVSIRAFATAYAALAAPEQSRSGAQSPSGRDDRASRKCRREGRTRDRIDGVVERRNCGQERGRGVALYGDSGPGDRHCNSHRRRLFPRASGHCRVGSRAVELGWLLGDCRYP
jgi:L-asparaginase II